MDTRQAAQHLLIHAERDPPEVQAVVPVDLAVPHVAEDVPGGDHHLVSDAGRVCDPPGDNHLVRLGEHEGRDVLLKVELVTVTFEGGVVAVLLRVEAGYLREQNKVV